MSTATSSIPARHPAHQPQKKVPGAKTLGEGRSSQANQRAAVILESLAGERTAPQAAAALGMTVPNFYLLERKALLGLLRACEPQPKGKPKPGLERKVEQLQRELARCQRECQRQAALVRATQRAVGLPPPVRETGGKPGDRKRARRRRRVEARALRAARVLRQNSAGQKPPDGLEKSAETAIAAVNHVSQETEHVAAHG
jgi:hypothetical protein